MNKNAFQENTTYKICGYKGKVDPVCRRFMELGLVVGEKIRVCAKSLQKKVVLIEVRGYLLSVRASLLEKVQVEKC